MTARLHVISGDDSPKPAGPPGSADLEDAWYHRRSQIDSPSTEGIWRTDFTTEGGPAIHVYCRTQLAFVAWARHLGFDIRQQPKGQALLNEAAGDVEFRGHTYRTHLHYTRFADSGDIA